MLVLTVMVGGVDNDMLVMLVMMVVFMVMLVLSMLVLGTSVHGRAACLCYRLRGSNRGTDPFWAPPNFQVLPLGGPPTAARAGAKL